MPRNSKEGSTKISGLRQQSLLQFLPSSSLHQSSSRKGQVSMSGAHASRASSRHKARQDDVSDEDEQDNLSSNVEAIHFEPRRISSPFEVEDDPSQSPRRPKGSVKSATRSSPAFSAASGEGGLEEEMVVPSRGKRRDKAGAITVSDSNSEDEQPATKRRKFIKGERPLTPEPDSLADEVEQNRIIQSRLRTRDRKSQFQKHLEKLKRKKNGQSLLSSSESENGSEGSHDSTPFAGAKPGDVSGDEDHNGNVEDTFIVEDNEAALSLPVAFSMSSHQDLVHHFKIICQLFIHLAVRPVAEKRPFMELVLKDDEYFSVSLRMTRRKLSGLRDSLVASSVWRSDFRSSLETYPHFSLVHLGFALPHCDACHLGGRLSTLCGRLDGDRYDKLSFESVEADSRDEDGTDSDDDDNSISEGVKKEFNLGRFCAARTQTFHRFSHWEHHLYDSLRQEVDELRENAPNGKRKFVRVAYSKGLLPPEDLDDADSIMDWLDQRGVIDMEWQKVREMMESARKLEMFSGRNEDDIDLGT